MDHARERGTVSVVFLSFARSNRPLLTVRRGETQLLGRRGGAGEKLSTAELLNFFQLKEECDSCNSSLFKIRVIDAAIQVFGGSFFIKLIVFCLREFFRLVYPAGSLRRHGSAGLPGISNSVFQQGG